MSKKRMNDVFTNVVVKPGRDYGTNELHEENGGLIAVFYNTQGAHHAAHAINEHDGMLKKIDDRGKQSFFSGLAVSLQSIASWDEPLLAGEIINGLGGEVNDFANYMKSEGGVDGETLEWLVSSGVVKVGE